MKKILLWIIYMSHIVWFTSCKVPTAGVLILARGGSKGVTLKNLQKIGDKSLLRIAIETAKISGFSDITVSTDHPIIALEALKYKVSVFRRSKVTATDWAPSIWGASEFMSHRKEIDILVLLQVTSPFLKPSQLQKALTKLNEPIAFDCIFAVTRSHKLRWQYHENELTPINFNANKRPRRQDWLGEFIETGAFYITRRTLLQNGHFQNKNCTIWEVSNIESFEVDTYYDLRIANALHKENLV